MTVLIQDICKALPIMASSIQHVKVSINSTSRLSALSFNTSLLWSSVLELPLQRSDCADEIRCFYQKHTIILLDYKMYKADMCFALSIFSFLFDCLCWHKTHSTPIIYLKHSLEKSTKPAKLNGTCDVMLNFIYYSSIIMQSRCATEANKWYFYNMLNSCKRQIVNYCWAKQSSLIASWTVLVPVPHGHFLYRPKSVPYTSLQQLYEVRLNDCKQVSCHTLMSYHSLAEPQYLVAVNQSCEAL